MKVAPKGSPAGVLEFGSSATRTRQVKAGRALRLAPGIYAMDASLPPEAVARHHCLAVVARVWPGAVISDRSAFSGGRPAEGWLFIRHPDPARRSNLRLPGITISVEDGPGALPGDMPMPHGLHLSGVARGLVENVTSPGPAPTGRPARAAGTEATEEQMDALARDGGPGRIRNVLGELDLIKGSFGRPAVEAVRRRLAELLGTHTDSAPLSPRLRARLEGEPFDAARLALIERLVAGLGTIPPEPAPAIGGPGQWEWLPFFEAYFSNYIEGTEFTVEEALRIAVDNEIPASRPQDAHDVAATYRIVSDPQLAAHRARSGAELLDILREHHATLMAARPEKRPGLLKQKRNWAGGYQFVEPELLVGTLTRGFDLLAPVTDPLHRAVTVMFLVTECHPFDDGNGRVARIVANSELSAAGQIRLIVPTVYRSNYLAGLAGASNGAGRGESLTAVLRFTQRWVAGIDWRTFDAADAEIRETNGYLDPVRAENAAQRLRLPGSVPEVE
ncbi:cell filamentation protein Fic [Streptomyces lunaelactis]|uniref:Cell filamentation protein Fic n=1 Tax=Streptomyces lunaelactis TaxID=1535768 RepID=A0A2R4T2S9_9ACTN|nr:Fic family protein [Streptomyces lunaelactis]AVZ73422.1 cell filamentation protein Fic [Streptomyces lunaelactis]NUK88402.1 Fic family protein [Streptomyces lunaelactis]